MLSSSLSATGSRYWPSMVRCLSRRASEPSSASVKPGGHKQAKAQRVVAVQDGGHQERRQADAQQREQVGSGAEWVQSWVRIVVHGGFKSALDRGAKLRPVRFRDPSQEAAARTDELRWPRRLLRCEIRASQAEEVHSLVNDGTASAAAQAASPSFPAAPILIDYLHVALQARSSVG